MHVLEAENDLYVTAENFPESATKLVLNDIPIIIVTSRNFTVFWMPLGKRNGNCQKLGVVLEEGFHY